MKVVKKVTELLKLKGKQAEFLLMFTQKTEIFDSEFRSAFGYSKENCSSNLRALKYVITCKLESLRIRKNVVIKGIHNKNGKNGYTLYIEYNNP